MRTYRRGRRLEGRGPEYFLGLFMNMLSMRHSNEVEHMRGLSKLLQERADTGTIDVACCCQDKPFDSHYRAGYAEEYERELDLEVLQRTNNHEYFVGWHNLELFAVRPAKCLLYYAPVSVFWIKFESLRLLPVPPVP